METAVSAPMAFAFTVDAWLFLVLKVLAVLLEVWAFSDALRRRPADFVRAGQRDKSFWLLVTGVALAVGVLSLLFGAGGLGLFALAAVSAASVYLAGPRGEMARGAR